MPRHSRKPKAPERNRRTQERLRKQEIEDLPSAAAGGGGGAPIQFTTQVDFSAPWVYDTDNGLWLMSLKATSGWPYNASGWTLADPMGLGYKTSLVPPGPGFYVWGWEAAVQINGLGANMPEAYGGVWSSLNDGITGKPYFTKGYEASMDNVVPPVDGTGDVFRCGGMWATPMQKDFGNQDGPEYQGFGAYIIQAAITAISTTGQFPRFWAYGWPD